MFKKILSILLVPQWNLSMHMECKINKKLWYSQTPDSSEADEELIPSQVSQITTTDAKSCWILRRITN